MMRIMRSFMAVLSFMLIGGYAAAQTEVLTVQGNLPRVNYRDTTGNLIWAVPANNVLYKIDGPFNAGVFLVTAAAKSNSIVLNEGGLGIFNGFPAGPLHIGNLAAQVNPGEVRFHPGNATASATIHATNAASNTSMVLETQGVNRNVSLRLTNPGTSFIHAVSSNYAIRDAVNNVSPIVIFPNVANSNSIVIRNGRVGLGITNPTSPLQLANGAFCSAGGVWTNASSRSLKQDIQSLSESEAKKTLMALQPVSYAYKSDPQERHVGFIAEDVPDTVAMNSRKALAPMDFVGVLTKVIQEQESQLEKQANQIDEQARMLEAQQRQLEKLSQQMEMLSRAQNP